MNYKQQNGALQKEYGRHGFNFLQAALKRTGMRFSDRYNGLYDSADAAMLLLYMSRNGMSVVPRCRFTATATGIGSTCLDH